MQKFLTFLIFVSLVITASAKATGVSTLYPNELPRFKFYAKYLDPLQPYISDRKLVVRVLGSEQGIELGRWRITPLFVGAGSTANGHPYLNDRIGRLASIKITPKHRVSMLGVKFPGTFTYSTGGVSEINVRCDVYSDSFGLEYWLYREDSAAGKKGDLMQIEYGPGERVKQEVIGPS